MHSRYAVAEVDQERRMRRRQKRLGDREGSGVAVFTPVNARSYYDYLPSASHECGDIWANLPSMGLLSAHDTVTGIVVTPACDVSNFKAETLTYLPVISITTYLATVAFLPIVRREVFERYKSAKLAWSIDWPDKGYEPPSENSLNAEILRINQVLAMPRLSSGDKAHVERAAAGLRITAICRSALTCQGNINDYEILFGKQWNSIKKDIVKNAYRPDIHFLPSDQQSIE
ncbi:hypothetical protein [Sphingomonas sp. CFBP 8760]|uniref:hypothetical protein n=1 Tax=Sphingomonas sp. CFBP 8760 TaxID=2775282 RepID=UPI00177F0BDC|nr:hypothetical protein [Sphingomonas sp. CFBP 8760]MBD8548944.1 hypothetical protein [Sphingomonas sp. CFBP 8760]